MFGKKGVFRACFCWVLILTLVLSTLPGGVSWAASEAGSKAGSKNRDLRYAGEAVATGAALLYSTTPTGSAARLKMDAYPTPVFNTNELHTLGGTVVVSLVPKGVLEVHEQTVVRFGLKDGNTSVEVKSGFVRFSVPVNTALVITTPSVMINLPTLSRVASADSSVPLSFGNRSGGVQVLSDGRSFISSDRGMLEVTTGDGKAHVLDAGEALILDKKGLPPGREFITDSVRSQQMALRWPGAGRKSAVKHVPHQGEGEVVLTVPAAIGGGYIIGTPEAIAAGLKKIGLVTATPMNVMEMIKTGQVRAKGGLLSGFTRSQLSVFSGHSGVKVHAGLKKAPLLNKGEVALAIPGSIGAGFIVGPPDAIAKALSKALLVSVSSKDVMNMIPGAPVTTGTNLLAGLTRSQLSALSPQPGLRVVRADKGDKFKDYDDDDAFVISICGYVIGGAEVEREDIVEQVEEILKGFTRSQLSALSSEPGIKISRSDGSNETTAYGELALPLPGGIGGGSVVGTPEAIATGLNKVGLVSVTPDDIISSVEGTGVMEEATLLSTLTRSQLGALSSESGIKTITRIGTVPSLKSGEVVLAVPSEIGGGYIKGKPAVIVEGLNSAGLVTVTAVDVINASMEEEARRAFAWMPIVCGVVVAGAAAAALAGGEGSGAKGGVSIHVP